MYLVKDWGDILRFKGTVSVFKVTLQAKIAMSDSHRHPLHLWSKLWRISSISVYLAPGQTSDGTSPGLTNVQQYQRRTSTIAELVQTSDQYKRRTSTIAELVQTSDQYKRLTNQKKLF